MKKIAVAACVATIFIAGAASAADLPYTKAPPPPVVPVYSWTGCYVGGNIGVGFPRNHIFDATSAPGLDVGASAGAGVVGGPQAGCDYQLGNWVFGGRGLFDWTDGLQGSNPPSDAALATGIYTPNEVLGHKTPWFGTLTARVGYEVIPQWLLYVDGGAAWVKKKYSDIDPVVGFAGFASEIRTGWTVGGGVEYMFRQNWSVFAEYDFIGLGRHNVTLAYTEPGFAPFTQTFNFRQNMQTILFGANYRFGGPVVAKY